MSKRKKSYTKTTILLKILDEKENPVRVFALLEMPSQLAENLVEDDLPDHEILRRYHKYIKSIATRQLQWEDEDISSEMSAFVDVLNLTITNINWIAEWELHATT